MFHSCPRKLSYKKKTGVKTLKIKFYPHEEGLCGRTFRRKVLRSTFYVVSFHNFGRLSVGLEIRSSSILWTQNIARFNLGMIGLIVLKYYVLVNNSICNFSHAKIRKQRPFGYSAPILLYSGPP